MWDAITNLVQQLLGADFSKVTGIVGLLLILLGLIPGEIRIGPITIPPRGGGRSTCAIVLGIMFVIPPFLGLSVNTTIGSFNFGGSPAKTEFITETPSASGGLLIGSAYAASRSAEYTISQRTIADVSPTLDGPPSALYVGDVHLRDPTVFLIFRSGSPGSVKISSGIDLSESDIKNALSDSDIVFLKSLKQGDQETFRYSGKTYNLVVNNVIWYIAGTDVVKVTISQKK